MASGFNRLKNSIRTRIKNFGRKAADKVFFDIDRYFDREDEMRRKIKLDRELSNRRIRLK